MRGIDIGQMARDGEYCDICKKTIYVNILDHVLAHRREFQRREDARASEELMERWQCRAGFKAYKAGRYRPVEEFMAELEAELN